MLKQDFNIGPFTVSPAGQITLNGLQKQLFDIEYGHETMRDRIPVTPGTQSQVASQLEDALASVVSDLKGSEPKPQEVPFDIRWIELIDQKTGNAIDSMPWEAEIPGLSAGLIDDRFETWLVVDGRSMPIEIEEFERLKKAHYAALNARAVAEKPASTFKPKYGWIANLLPDNVMTIDPEEWRAPSSWEIRHVVGEGSLIGISGSKAAALVGVNPSSFRKYTAQDGAKSRQNMSFAMWHLLLHRLDVQVL